MENRICPLCKRNNAERANFCEYCGEKITEKCPSCWVKKGQSYNCGFEKCPGYRLPILEITQEK